MLATAAIFDQWVLLADAHPVDTFTQVVHVLEVLHPEVVQYLQVNVALNFAHNFWSEGRFAACIQFFGGGQQNLFELVSFGIEQCGPVLLRRMGRLRGQRLQTRHS